MAWKRLVEVTKEECEDYRYIDAHLAAARGALSRIGPDCSQKQMDMFALAQTKVVATYSILMEEFWKGLREKYKFPEEVHIHIDVRQGWLLQEE